MAQGSRELTQSLSTPFQGQPGREQQVLTHNTHRELAEGANSQHTNACVGDSLTFHPLH